MLTLPVLLVIACLSLVLALGAAPGVRLRALPVPGLADIPLVGDIFFRQSLLA